MADFIIGALAIISVITFIISRVRAYQGKSTGCCGSCSQCAGCSQGKAFKNRDMKNQKG